MKKLKDKEISYVRDIWHMIKDEPGERYQLILDTLRNMKPWRPMPSLWTDIFYQVLHVIIGLQFGIPLLGIKLSGIDIPLNFITIAAGFLAGFIAGSRREWEQWRNWDLKITMLWDRIKDTFFIGCGGALAVILVSLI